MVRKVKYGKILVVMFLTVLIWVWADLALDEPLADKPATIVVDESANPRLWVSFNQASSADIRITLSGPHSAIVDLDRKLKEGTQRLEFDLDAAQEKMDEPGDYTLTLLSFLQKDKEIKQLGLKVVSCEPQTIPVGVTLLVRKSLKVRCVDEDEIPIKGAIINPAQVDMFVPEDWRGEKQIASVRLIAREIDQARLTVVEKTPYIELPGGQPRQVPTTVKITMPPEEDPRRDYTITAAKLGFVLSPNLQGKYKAKVTNPEAVMSPIVILATPAAKQAYENMRYQVILEIEDSDKDYKSEEPLRRKLIYNFPEEFVRNDEIKLKGQPVEARFKLTPLPAARTP